MFKVISPPYLPGATAWSVGFSFPDFLLAGQARPPWDDAEYVDIALDISAGLKYLEKEKFIHR